MRAFLVCLILAPLISFAQRESFDIATFEPPAGWTKETKDFAVMYSTVDQTNGTWAQLIIYKSIKSSGDALTDFKSEWQSIVVKGFHPTTEPAPEKGEEDGWTIHSAGSTFNWQSKESVVTLTTISGYGVVMSVALLMNDGEYLDAAVASIESIDISKPAVVEPPVQPVQQSVSSPSAGIVVSDKPGTQGISISTTNFDDGWVAQPFADYVKVGKGAITVLLHYSVELDDEIRSTSNIEGTLFDRFILPRYTVSNIRKYDNDGPCYFCIYFFEADAVEKATGKKYHLGFRVVTNSGISRCIEILSPNSAAFQAEFPNQEKVEKMLGYNKFAVAKADLVGEWSSSSGSAVNMYNSVTGAYAGMNTSSSSDQFNFNSDGTYTSNHKGAFGMVGSMQFYDQKYKGEFTATYWDMVMTKRFDGKTVEFNAQFEAVRGGRVLHLVDKKYSGSTFDLVKVK